MKPIIIPFLYESLLERIVGGGSNWPRVLFWGGRGLGKSFFLQRLQDELREYGRNQPQLVHRRMLDAKAQVLAWAAAPAGTLLVDDFDRLFDPEIERALLSLPEENTGAWRLIVAAGDLRKIEEQTDWGGSPCLNTFHRERLDPWEGPWKRQLDTALRDALEQFRFMLPQENTAALPPLFREEGETAIDTWTQTITELSDGHPALVATAFAGLVGLLERYPYLQPAETTLLISPSGSHSAWTRSITSYLEDCLWDKNGGLDVIATAIRRFNAQTDFFDDLVLLARSENAPPEIADPRIRYALRDSGLVHRDPSSGMLVVVGKLVRQRILEIAKEAAPKASTAKPTVLAVEADEDSPDEQGTIHYTSSDRDDTGTLVVRGVLWRLLKCLAEDPTKPVSIPLLIKRVGFESPAAARSALQRLRDHLKDNKLEGLVENVRGRGYRFSKKLPKTNTQLRKDQIKNNT